MADEIRPYGPGKFNTILDSAVWNLAQEGTDDELADQGFGWRGKILAHEPLGTEVVNIIEHPKLNQAEIDFLNLKVGAILTETTDGHVDVEYFDEQADLDQRWAEIQEEFTEFAGDEESMDGDPGDQDPGPAGDDVPLPGEVTDEMLAQAKADGAYDAANHGATPESAPDPMRLTDWENTYGYTQELNPEKMGLLIDAWRAGVGSTSGASDGSPTHL